MSNELMVLGGQLPAYLQGSKVDDALGAGVQASFASLTYKGKQWGIKHRGETTVLMRDDGTGPMFELEVCIVKASPTITKIFYANAYKEGSDEAPDCFSVDGIKPDPGAKAKQCDTCAGCQHNIWGSKTSENGSKGKACSDGKRLAVVPVGDMRNDRYGGPMLLRIPPASLQGMSTYSAKCQASGVPYDGIVTALAFDPTVAYPHITFSGRRYLTEEQFKVSQELAKGPQVARILSEPVDMVKAEPGKPGAPGVPVEPAGTQAPGGVDFAAIAAQMAAEAKAAAEEKAEVALTAAGLPVTADTIAMFVKMQAAAQAPKDATVGANTQARVIPPNPMAPKNPTPVATVATVAPPAAPMPDPPVVQPKQVDDLAIPIHLNRIVGKDPALEAPFGGGGQVIEGTATVVANTGGGPVGIPAAAAMDPDYAEFLAAKAAKAAKAKKPLKARVANPSPAEADTTQPAQTGAFGSGGTPPATASPSPVVVPGSADPTLVAQPGAGSASIASIDAELEKLVG